MKNIISTLLCTIFFFQFSFSQEEWSIKAIGFNIGQKFITYDFPTIDNYNSSQLHHFGGKEIITKNKRKYVFNNIGVVYSTSSDLAYLSYTFDYGYRGSDEVSYQLYDEELYRDITYRVSEKIQTFRFKIGFYFQDENLLVEGLGFKIGGGLGFQNTVLQTKLLPVSFKPKQEGGYYSEVPWHKSYFRSENPSTKTDHNFGGDLFAGLVITYNLFDEIILLGKANYFLSSYFQVNTDLFFFKKEYSLNIGVMYPF